MIRKFENIRSHDRFSVRKKFLAIKQREHFCHGTRNTPQKFLDKVLVAFVLLVYLLLRLWMCHCLDCCTACRSSERFWGNAYCLSVFVRLRCTQQYTQRWQISFFLLSFYFRTSYFLVILICYKKNPHATVISIF